MKTENTNRAFFERFFSDEELRVDLIRNVGEEFHRRHGEDEPHNGDELRCYAGRCQRALARLARE